LKRRSGRLVEIWEWRGEFMKREIRGRCVGGGLVREGWGIENIFLWDGW